MRNYYLRWAGISVLAGVAAAGLSAVAFAQTSTVIIAPSAPPPPRVESVPPPPPATGATMSWQAGHWAWNGAAWSWEEGALCAGSATGRGMGTGPLVAAAGRRLRLG